MQHKLMKTDKQLERISVAKYLLDVQPPLTHCHNYYEFICIRSGKGIHHHQGQVIAFDKGDLFFVRPNESHSFEAIEPAEVAIIRYTEDAKVILKEMIDNSQGKAVSLSKAKSPLNHKITFKEDGPLVLEIYNIMLLLNAHAERNENLIYYQLICLITIIERNLTYNHKKENKEQFEVQNLEALTRHIHKNLRNPKELNADHLSKKFNIPLNYIGIYFKRNMDKSLKGYITDARLAVIAQILRTSTVSLSQVTFEFGFVDESHFYKSFKKAYGMSPSDYRTMLKGH